MANIIIPKNKVYLSKPQEGEIDWSNRLTQDLVCAFLFNERTGTRCRNLVNPELSGLIKNAVMTSVWDNGYLGGPCVHMDGSDDYIEVPDHKYLTSIASSYPVSFSLALNYDVDQATNGRILCKTDDSTHAWMFTKATSNSRLELSMKPFGAISDPTAPNAGQQVKCHTPEPSPGIWTKYFVQWDTRRSVGDIYTNGIRTGTRSNIVNAIGHSSNPTLDIGGRNDSSVSFDGKIAYVFLWRRVFNNAEIIEHQANPFGFIKKRVNRTYFALNVAGGTNATATPSLATITIKVNTATASTSQSYSATATPSLASVTITVKSPTVSTTQTVTVNPGVNLIKFAVNSPSVSSSRSSTATPSLKTITLLVVSPTTTVKESRTVSPSSLSIRIVVNSPSVSASGQVSGITVRIVLKSEIEKYINSASRINKYILEKSEINKFMYGKSKINND